MASSTPGEFRHVDDGVWSDGIHTLTIEDGGILTIEKDSTSMSDGRFTSWESIRLYKGIIPSEVQFRTLLGTKTAHL